MESCFSHIALLVPSVEKSAQFLKSRGLETGTPETFESEGTKEVYVGSYATQAGLLLLLEAISEGPYKRAMEKRGPSLHHIALDVLDIEKFITKALKVGWELHAASEQTMEYKTAWFFLKGVPTLIEVHQKKELSSKPIKVSRIEIPIANSQMALFDEIGLKDIISIGPELFVTIDGKKLSFAQIAFQ